MKSLSLAVNSDTHLEAFFVGDNGKVQHIYQTGSNMTDWTKAQDLLDKSGNAIKKADSVSAVTGPSGQIEVLAHNNDGFYLIEQTGDPAAPWGKWQLLSQS